MMASIRFLLDAANMAENAESNNPARFAEPSSCLQNDAQNINFKSDERENPSNEHTKNQSALSTPLINLPSISYVTSQIPVKLPEIRQPDMFHPGFPFRPIDIHSYFHSTQDNNMIPLHVESLLKNESVSVGIPEAVFKCPLSECRKKIWSPFFNTIDDYKMHMSFHQCQWSVESSNSGLYVTCKYVPSSTEDALHHLERHIDNDPLPQIRKEFKSSDDSNSKRSVYFCPIQTCVSQSYAEKGSCNKAHVYQHIRKHLG